MPSFEVQTPQRTYPALVQRGAISRVKEFLPADAGRLVIVSTKDVWPLHGETLAGSLAGADFSVVFFAGGEENKRLNEIERLAEEMAGLGADRSSVVVSFGGGIACDVAGFLAASFMRGVQLIQIPTTLLAQVDAGVGGKTGVNLAAGKNLLGAFHQPLAALIDPNVLSTLPEREYRAGLFEVVKCGVIRSPKLFHLLSEQPEAILALDPLVIEAMIAKSVAIKAEVVSTDERESGLRRILNFGHTFGHALEAETGYSRFLHGEAVAYGMKAAAHLAQAIGILPAAAAGEILRVVDRYGPIPSFDGVSPERITARMLRDKKTVRGKVHFVLPERIGQVRVVSGLDEEVVLAAARAAFA
jgi:3-dehydroquinate synthase